MAEYLGMGDRGTAKYIYFRTLLLQMGMATICVAGLLYWVLQDSSTEYRLASLLIVLSIWPAMVNSISSQANVANEDLLANLPSSIASVLTFFSFGNRSYLLLHWGVLGVGASIFTFAVC